eukprot:423943_1
MADDEYTPEQKAKIARHFLYVTPHGEVNELIKDLKKIVSNDIINDEWMQQSMTEYNKRRFEIVSGDTSKVICCPQAEVEPNKYLNPDKKIVCTVDPVKQKIIKEDDASNLVGGGLHAEYRGALATKLKEYLSAFYEDGTSPNSVANGTGSVYVSPQGQVAIVISYKNLNQNNYWTGGWQSEWTLNVNKKGSTKLEGRIRINVHYFEDGNVQLNSTFNENGEVDVSDPAATSEVVINTIQTLENDFQKKLDQFYVQMHDSTFKNMRRFLPKIGKKMDWRASVHNLVTEAAGQ